MKIYVSWYEIIKYIRNHVGARGMVRIKFVIFFHLLWTWIPTACKWIHFVTWKIYLSYCATTIITLFSIGKLFYVRSLHITWKGCCNIPSLLLPFIGRICHTLEHIHIFWSIDYINLHRCCCACVKFHYHYEVCV
jgi:hypothetical protein